LRTWAPPCAGPRSSRSKPPSYEPMSGDAEGGGGPVREGCVDEEEEEEEGPGTRRFEADEGGLVAVEGAAGRYLVWRPVEEAGGAYDEGTARYWEPVVVDERAVAGGASWGLRSEVRPMLDEGAVADEGPLVEGRMMGASCCGREESVDVRVAWW